AGPGGGGQSGRLGYPAAGDSGGPQFLIPQPVACNFDAVIPPPQDAEISIRGLERAVAGKVGPVSPILTVLVPAILLIICTDVAFGLSPDRLEDAWPRDPG